MSENNPIHLFVTHEFAEDEDYLRVFEYLESRDKFFYHNCSRPGSRPASKEPDALQEELRSQIKQAEVVVCPVRPGADLGLMRFQLIVAQAFKIPVVVINSFGGTVPMPQAVLDAATSIVDWNDRMIIDSIRQTARGEDTASWDVIDFDPDEFG